MRLAINTHPFLSPLRASATSAFSGAERAVVKTSTYLLSLVTCTWLFYEKGEACCLQAGAGRGGPLTPVQCVSPPLSALHLLHLIEHLRAGGTIPWIIPSLRY